MATAVEQIGLFPLGVVLFPGTYLPLHIYEPRYRQLIGECLSSRLPFGINLLDEGDLHLIGCTAEVEGIVRRYDDGRLDIVVVGRRRYVLQSFDDQSKPYFVGTIEYIEDRPDGAARLESYRHCVTLYNALVERVFPNPDRLKLPTDAIPEIKGSTPSFFMAQKAGLKLVEKQVVLSLQSENERLEFIAQHLAELLPRLDRAEELYRIARTDGYLTPDRQL
ncbi:MAG: hypothetical protein KatS3mg039_0889 [Candidatus Kapaibacterium sp.]|nr:MAG: hypothetical protein KatS3mg039_0889 [Candidatus Kapabacteria bacterium]